VNRLRKAGTPLTAALKAAGLAKSSYFYVSKPRKPRPLDPALVRALEDLCRGREAVYGYRKMRRALLARGILVNPKKLLRHTKALGIQQPRKTRGMRWTRPRLVRPEAANRYWEADMTYVWTGEGFAYVFGIIDPFDHDIVGDVLSDRCRAMEAVESLEAAVLARFGGRVPDGESLILRVDRGTQYVARKFRDSAKRLGVTLEYAGIQCPEDKPYIESFFGKFKVEEVHRNDYASLAEARAAWESYRAWYRSSRFHQSLGYKTPAAFGLAQQKVAVPAERPESKLCTA
jgi:putative transposase